LNFRSTIIGIAASAILLAVLGIARLFTIQPQIVDLTVREVDTAIFQPPPPPPPFEEPSPDAPPPPPALTEVSSIPDPTRIPVPLARVPMDITAPVENFFADTPPETLPLTPPLVKPIAKPTTPEVQVAPAVKTHYKQNELDGTPRLLRHGSVTFPSSLSKQGIKSGTVTLEVELTTTGSVFIRRVISSTHAELIAPARKVAESARFTPPTKNGQAVKAIMNWPITIEK
jgi:protein TonB